MTTQTAITLLEVARDLIDDGTERWICYALDVGIKLNDHLEDGEEIHTLLTDYIAWAINNSALLNQWVAAELGVDHISNNIARLARLAWIDRMIHELKTNGKLP